MPTECLQLTNYEKSDNEGIEPEMTDWRAASLVVGGTPPMPAGLLPASVC